MNNSYETLWSLGGVIIVLIVFLSFIEPALRHFLTEKFDVEFVQRTTNQRSFRVVGADKRKRFIAQTLYITVGLGLLLAMIAAMLQGVKYLMSMM